MLATYAIVVSGNVKESALKLELAGARTDAANAIMQGAALNERAAGLEKEAAAANERTAEIEKLTAWRKLDSIKMSKLATALAAVPVSVPHRIVFAYAQNDDESLYFLFQIGRLFLATKNWDAYLQARTYPGMLYWGVRVTGPDNETTRAVRKALTDAEIEFATDDVPGRFQSFGYQSKPDDAVILVGPKKPPFEP